MIFTNKTFAKILFCGIVVSTAYAFVAASEHFAAGNEPAELSITPTDTTQQAKPKFPIKKYKQDTPLKFLINLRMEEAKRLIVEHPELDYKVIGEMVGYFDCHYFYKVFKSFVGKTPTEFRVDFDAKSPKST